MREELGEGPQGNLWTALNLTPRCLDLIFSLGFGEVFNPRIKFSNIFMMISLAADKKVRWDGARRLARSPVLRLSWELWPEVTKTPKAAVEGRVGFWRHSSGRIHGIWFCHRLGKNWLTEEVYGDKSWKQGATALPWQIIARMNHPLRDRNVPCILRTEDACFWDTSVRRYGLHSCRFSFHSLVQKYLLGPVTCPVLC